MSEYIVILDPDTTDCALMEDISGFAKRFSNFEDAKKDAEEYKKYEDCRNYRIYQEVKE